MPARTRIVSVLRLLNVFTNGLVLNSLYLFSYTVFKRWYFQKWNLTGNKTIDLKLKFGHQMVSLCALGFSVCPKITPSQPWESAEDALKIDTFICLIKIYFRLLHSLLRHDRGGYVQIWDRHDISTAPSMSGIETELKETEHNSSLNVFYVHLSPNMFHVLNRIFNQQ